MKLLVPPLPAENASGAYIFANQKKYFDGISSWWVITHGHCHPKVMEAIREQTRRFDQVNFANFSHDIAEALIDELSFVLPQELSVAFFSDNGSTAVESAMKMALQAQSQRGFSERKKFLTFENAYHGDTSGAMSVNADG
ncbi:aminotransferase class III-fold pyridoxal phosphate-dependent enzyme, partial [Vibrio parahaemolyticus]